MTRSLFDPERAVGAERVEPVRMDTPARPAEAGRAEGGQVSVEGAPLTVRQASELINGALEGGLPRVMRVVGQVSNLKAGNHWYFSLKDEQAVLLCVVWATSVRRIRFKPKDGDEVVVSGHVSHYAAQGRTQLYVEAMQPVGAGALDVKFRALCDELRGLGYFADERKKPLPMFPRKVAVITSATGAALTDVLKTSVHRCKAIGLIVVDVRVQGDGAAEEIARAIRWVDRSRQRLGVDAILVTRGGGSNEDLWAFNERLVADAVFGCALPVVAAIGHESDTTVIELVADVRASTPTQAAMRLIPDAKELGRQIEYLVRRMAAMVEGVLSRKREAVRQLRAEVGHRISEMAGRSRSRLERAIRRLGDLQPRAQIARRHARVAMLVDRLERVIPRNLERMRARIAGLERQLTAINPEGVLRRGYSLTMRADGSLVRSLADVEGGEGMVTRVADGEIESVVSGARGEAREVEGVLSRKREAEGLDG